MNVFHLRKQVMFKSCFRRDQKTHLNYENLKLAFDINNVKHKLKVV